MRMLIHGKDTFLSLMHLKDQVDTVKRDNLEYLYVNASENSSTQIISLLTTQDMFANSKLIIFKRLYSNKEKEGIISYLINEINNLNPSYKYIFWEDQKIPSNTKYFKLFTEKIEGSSMNKPTFYKWAGELASKSNIVVDNNTLRILSSRVNYLPERFQNELEKYILEGKDRITTKDIEENTIDTAEKQIWDLTKSINYGDKSSTFNILKDLYNQNTDPMFIIAMIVRNLRQTVLTKHLFENGSTTSQICSKLRIPPFTISEILGSAKNSDWDKLKYIYEKITSLDYEIKRGNIDAQIGLTLLLSRF